MPVAGEPPTLSRIPEHGEGEGELGESEGEFHGRLRPRQVGLLAAHEGLLVAHEGSLPQTSPPARRRPRAMLEELQNTFPAAAEREHDSSLSAASVLGGRADAFAFPSCWRERMADHGEERKVCT